MDDLYKLNYLLDALQGEAKETVKQFEVSRTTCPLVIAHLKKKYGDAQALVEQMVRRLQGAKAQSDRLDDQEKLCEHLASIIAQLQIKGENVDNIFLQKQLLGKFSERIQRHALREQQQQSLHSAWTTNNLLTSIKEYIATELKVTRRIEKAEHHGVRTEPRKDRKLPTTIRFSCFYCGGQDHPPKDCYNATTREERLEIMSRKRLCQNCGSKEHIASHCKGGACRLCKQHGHHTSVCEQSSWKPPPSVARKSPAVHNNKSTPQTSKAVSRRTPKTPPTSTKVHTVVSEQDGRREEEKDIPTHVNYHGGHADVYILVGQAQVFNPEDQALEAVHVMLDTGADRSFISNALANRLQLPDLGSVELSINTFGSLEPLKKSCGVTELQLWDAKGKAHRIKVTKVDTLTEPMRRSTLSPEDKRFLFDHDIRLSIDSRVTNIQPQVLLGCTDLYSLLDNGLGAQMILPSGLQLISSKLGYPVSGQGANQVASVTNDPSSADEVNTCASTSGDELQSWEDFCTFESTGVREFAGSITDEREAVDIQVWKAFQRTIEKLEDGYHVRLPWKEDAERLPDNKAIAVRRLESMKEKLDRDPTILQQYHETIMRQLEQGIIEEVDENAPSDGTIVHYLAHRAVLTPHKETTKLRVVYDASAHLKGQPSLNDVLYQGPVLLPRICDILMRFRIGDIALTSDVEKAFLQIRLHQKDRNATRFLWLRDTARPLCPENIIVFRFTRVTFGLNCSPFLLAGTIKHHLENYVEDVNLAKTVSDNTYVDNVIVTSPSLAEASQLYHDSKHLFQQLNMNLREFRSNSDELNKKIASTDLSGSMLQKVLGIPWKSQEDQLQLRCRYLSRTKLTKRVVSEQIASVYDPLGLLTPLTLRGKQFLQNLWKMKYDWDTPLSEVHQQIWKTIIDESDGFEIALPREVAQIGASAILVLFADASGSGLCACSYIASEGESHLIFAKSKLPSLKDISTIPKLELNALTMAARIAHSVYNAIHHQVHITTMVILSDSNIALSWIKSPSVEKSAGVLVRNRVAEIRRIVERLPVSVHFGYVGTHENPADCGTRGLQKAEMENHFWWHGPEFLKRSVQDWPRETVLFELTPGRFYNS